MEADKTFGEISSAVPAAIAGHGVNVALIVGGGTLAGLPDAACKGVGSRSPGSHLMERVDIEGDDPTVIAGGGFAGHAASHEKSFFDVRTGRLPERAQKKSGALFLFRRNEMSIGQGAGLDGERWVNFGAICDVEGVELVGGVGARAVGTGPTDDVKCFGVDVNDRGAEDAPADVDAPEIDLGFVEAEDGFAGDVGGDRRADVGLPDLGTGIHVESIDVVGHRGDDKDVMRCAGDFEFWDIKWLSFDARVVAGIEREFAKFFQVANVGGSERGFGSVGARAAIVVGAGENLCRESGCGEEKQKQSCEQDLSETEWGQILVWLH